MGSTLDGPTDPPRGDTDGPVRLPEELRARYVPEAVLGRGGFGEVLRCRDRELDRPVAVKLLVAPLDDEEARARFAREARATAAVRHPHVVQVLDYGVSAAGEPWLVYEYVPGPDLETRIGSGQALPVGTLAGWGRDLAGALQAVHDAGLVHRDVKPGNVLLRDGAVPLLCDLGIAWRAGGRTVRTAEGLVLGTPQYMAPEVVTGRDPAGPASDQYGLAATLYRVWTGGLPLGVGLAGILERVREGRGAEVPLPGEAGPERELALTLRRALALSPADRFGSCREFGTALDRACRASGPGRTLIAAATVVSDRAAPGRETAGGGQGPVPEGASSSQPVSAAGSAAFGRWIRAPVLVAWVVVVSALARLGAWSSREPGGPGHPPALTAGPESPPAVARGGPPALVAGDRIPGAAVGGPDPTGPNSRVVLDLERAVRELEVPWLAAKARQGSASGKFLKLDLAWVSRILPVLEACDRWLAGLSAVDPDPGAQRALLASVAVEEGLGRRVLFLLEEVLGRIDHPTLLERSLGEPDGDRAEAAELRVEHSRTVFRRLSQVFRTQRFSDPAPPLLVGVRIRLLVADPEADFDALYLQAEQGLRGGPRSFETGHLWQAAAKAILGQLEAARRGTGDRKAECARFETRRLALLEAVEPGFEGFFDGTQRGIVVGSLRMLRRQQAICGMAPRFEPTCRHLLGLVRTLAARTPEPPADWAPDLDDALEVLGTAGASECRDAVVAVLAGMRARTLPAP